MIISMKCNRSNTRKAGLEILDLVIAIGLIDTIDLPSETGGAVLFVCPDVLECPLILRFGNREYLLWSS